MLEQLKEIFPMAKDLGLIVEAPSLSPEEKAKLEKLARFGVNPHRLHQWLFWKNDLKDLLAHIPLEECIRIQTEYQDCLQAFGITADQILQAAYEGYLQFTLSYLDALFKKANARTPELCRQLGIRLQDIEAWGPSRNALLSCLLQVPAEQYEALKQRTDSFQPRKIIAFVYGLIEQNPTLHKWRKAAVKLLGDLLIKHPFIFSQLFESRKWGRFQDILSAERVRRWLVAQPMVDHSWVQDHFSELFQHIRKITRLKLSFQTMLTSMRYMDFSSFLRFFAEHPLGSKLAQKDLCQDAKLLAQKIKLILNFSGHLDWSPAEVTHYQKRIFDASSPLNFEDLKWINDHEGTLVEDYQWSRQALWTFATEVEAGRDKLELLLERRYQYAEGHFVESVKTHSILSVYFSGISSISSEHAKFFIREFLKLAEGDVKQAYQRARSFFRRDNFWLDVFFENLSKETDSFLLAKEGGAKFRLMIEAPLCTFIQEASREDLQALLALPYGENGSFFKDIFTHFPLIQALGLSLRQALQLQQKTCFRLLEMTKKLYPVLQSFFPALVLASLHEGVSLAHLCRGFQLFQTCPELSSKLNDEKIIGLLNRRKDFSLALSTWGELSSKNIEEAQNLIKDKIIEIILNDSDVTPEAASSLFFCQTRNIPCSLEEAGLLHLFKIPPERIVQYHEEGRLKFFLPILKKLRDAYPNVHKLFSEDQRNMHHALQMLRLVRYLGPQNPETFTVYQNWLWVFSEALHLIKSLEISPEQLLEGVQEAVKHEKFDLPFETILRLIQAGCLVDTLGYLDSLDAENSEVKKIITYLCTLDFNLAPFEKLEDFFTWIKDDPNFLQLYWLKVYLLHSTMITSCPMITPQWVEEHLEVFLKISQLQVTFPKILAIPSVEILEFIATLKDDQISEFLKLYEKLSEKHEKCIPILTALHPRVAYSTLSKILRLTGSLGLALPKLLDFFNKHPMGKVVSEGELLNIDEALAKKIQFFAREPHEALWFQDLLAHEPEVIRFAFKVLSTEDFEYLKMHYEELTDSGNWPGAEIWRLVLSKSGMAKLKHIIGIAAAFKQRYADYAASHSLIEFYVNYQSGVNQSNFTFLVLKCRQIAQNVDIDAYVCARRFFDISHPWREICMSDLNLPPEDSWLRKDEGYKFIQILQFGYSSFFEGAENQAALSALLTLPLRWGHWFFEEIVTHIALIEAIGLSLPQVLKIKNVTDNSACLTVIQQEIVDIQAIAPELFLTAIHRCVLRVVEQFPDLPLTYFLRGLSLFSKAVTEEFLAISLQRLPEAKEFCQRFARLGEQASGPGFFASTSTSTCPADLALELMMFLDSPAPGPE